MYLFRGVRLEGRQDPATYPPLANMTGANRLLIGIGWSVVVLAALAARRRRDPDASPEDRSAE